MTETNAVSLKLPTFWTAQPQVWFEQAEAQFTIHGITADQTKYAYIVAALDQVSTRTQQAVSSIYSVILQQKTYETIKACLLKTFGLTRRVQANKLLHMDELGDRMPSALMDEMLDGHQPCMLFEQLFLNRMPDSIRLQLANADFTDPHKVAERADELLLSMDTYSGPAIHKATVPRRQAKWKPTSSAKDGDSNSNPDYCFYHKQDQEVYKTLQVSGKLPGRLSVAMAAGHNKTIASSMLGIVCLNAVS